MAKRIFSVPTFTPAALADVINLTNGAYLAIGASGATAGLLVSEIYQGGLNTSSAVNLNMFARDHIIGATPTALAAPNSDGPMSTMTAALAATPITYVGATTIPQRSTLTSAARLNLSFNSFGGIVRWVAYPGEEWGIIGVSVDVSESTLSGYTGSGAGLQGAHIVYEPF
jgi:hypothetical protein